MKALLTLTAITGILLTGCTTNAYQSPYGYNSYQPSYRTTRVELNIQPARQIYNRPAPRFCQEQQDVRREVNVYRRGSNGSYNYEGYYSTSPAVIELPDGRRVVGPHVWN